MVVRIFTAASNGFQELDIKEISASSFLVDVISIKKNFFDVNGLIIVPLSFPIIFFVCFFLFYLSPPLICAC